MKILHTSDWHLGHSLGEQRRTEEFENFLNWLAELLTEEFFDALIVTGDVFDNGAPSNKTREIYYAFLAKAAKSKCQNIIITAGNHDSPSFLNAPKSVLKNLNIHVVAAAQENLEDEIVVVKSADGTPKGIICAVPYLRDRDVRTVGEAETGDIKKSKQREAVKDHYKNICDTSEKITARLKLENENLPDLPIVATGHLFVAGAKNGNGKDDVIVGALSKFDCDVFDERIDYVALGHIHSAQKIDGRNNIRYCGSPLALSFDQTQTRKILAVNFDKKVPLVSEIEVPQTRTLKRIVGSDEEIFFKLNELKSSGESAFVEIDFNGDNPVVFRKEVEAIVANSKIAICKIWNKKIYNHILHASIKYESLENISTIEVFERRMDFEKIEEAERVEFRQMYAEILERINSNSDVEDK